MLALAGILVIVMASVLVRMGTQHYLVECNGVDNDITQSVLSGTSYGLAKENRYRMYEREVAWEKYYPFKHKVSMSHKSKKEKITSSFKANTRLIGQIYDCIKSNISLWTGENLLFYYYWVELGRNYEYAVSWSLINPERKVACIGEGFWFGIKQRSNQMERANSINDLSKFIHNRGGRFLYVQAPGKVNKYGDSSVNGVVDFSNQNADELLNLLNEQGVETLDLRESLHTCSDGSDAAWHSFFFRTDHHWKPETALLSAKILSDKIKDYGIPVDDTFYSSNSFRIDIIPNFFLGSSGKKITLARTKPDDFPILYPLFPTKLHFFVPSLNMNTVGDFSITYNKQEFDIIDHYGIYGRSPYSGYGYARRPVEYIDNMLLPATSKKILIIRDSFASPVGPFLALGVRHIAMVCPTFFTGSIRAFIEEYNPDLVIMMYYVGNLSGQIKWKTHKDNFDFR